MSVTRQESPQEEAGEPQPPPVPTMTAETEKASGTGGKSPSQGW